MDRATGQGFPWVTERTAVPACARSVVIVHSDIVGSTRLIEAAGPRYPELLVRHRALVAREVTRRGGRYLAHGGDGTLAVFDDPATALRAAAAVQRTLAAEPWPDGLAVRVRIGVHAGEVTEIDGEPIGLPVNHGARIMGLAHAGQVVVTDAVVTALDAGGRANPDLALADAGRHAVRDVEGPVLLRQLVGDGLTVVVPDDAAFALAR